ncbi:hypothetical protein GQX74_012407 [Glossina fuscipes]|nr:hypothetical protein GQX74_012407 [Glossina fuscipes]
METIYLRNIEICLLPLQIIHFVHCSGYIGNLKAMAIIVGSDSLVVKQATLEVMDYPPQMDFTTPPLPMAHLQPVTQASIISGASLGNGGTGGTLRRGILRGVTAVPPPDVTHHTTTNMGGVQLLHDLHPMNISATSSTLTTTSSLANGSLMSIPCSTPKQPQSILKDPNRNKQQQQQQAQLLNTTGLVAIPATAGNLQLLNIPTSAGIGNSLLMTASASYDPTNPHSLTTFNAAGSAVAYTDADGHLV